VLEVPREAPDRKREGLFTEERRGGAGVFLRGEIEEKIAEKKLSELFHKAHRKKRVRKKKASGRTLELGTSIVKGRVDLLDR